MQVELLMQGRRLNASLQSIIGLARYKVNYLTEWVKELYCEKNFVR